MNLVTISMMAMLMATSSHSLFEHSFVDQMDRNGATIICGTGDELHQSRWPLPRLPLCVNEGQYVRWGHYDPVTTHEARSRVERLLEAREHRRTGLELSRRLRRLSF